MSKFGAFFTLICIALFSLTLNAQTEPEILKRRDIEALIEFDFKFADIKALVEGKKSRIEIDAFDIKHFKKKGASKELLDWLQTFVKAEDKKPEAKALGIEDIIALWTAKTEEKTIRQTLRQRGVRGKVGVDEVLAMSRAGLPASLMTYVREMTESTTAKVVVQKKLTLDEVVKLSARGMTDEELITRIRKEDARFELGTDRVLQLRQEGVSLPVIREMYARRQEQKVGAPGATGPESRATSASTGPVKGGGAVLDAAGTEIEIFRPRDGRFSMLAPKDFVRSEEFAGRKALVQMVEASSANGSDLPDLELSVLTVKPRENQSDRLTLANLQSVAQRFVTDLQSGLATDGVKMTSRPSTLEWLTGQQAARIETTSTSSDGKSYRGAHLVVFGGGRIHVVSYSVRAEMVKIWRPILERCACSLTLRDSAAPAVVPLEDGGDRAALKALFESWKSSLKRLDYDLYRKLHASDGKSLKERRAFVDLASKLAHEKKRVEMDILEVESGTIGYKTFGLDGTTAARLRARKDNGNWVLETP